MNKGCPFFIKDNWPSCPRCVNWHTNDCPYHNTKNDDIDKLIEEISNDLPYLRGGLYEN